MKNRPTRIDTLRSISAIGAGVLLAATPRCGGKSEGSADDSSDRGGAAGDSGGGSGNAGHGGSGNAGYSGAPGTGGVVTGGYGGVGVGAYGGAVGLGGSGGSYGGSVGIGGHGGSYGGSIGMGGSCSLGGVYCWEPEELIGCAGTPDAGVDGGNGGDGEGGAAGEAGELPLEPAAYPEPDARIYVREAGIPQPPEGFSCPTAPAFPQCVMSDIRPPAPPYTSLGWNGTMCCYQFYTCF